VLLLLSLAALWMLMDCVDVTVQMPAQFGGYRVMRNPSVAPVHVPDVVRLDRVGGPVDISDKIVLGPGAKMSLEMAAGEEGNGQFDDLVGTDRVSAAQKKLAFGKEEWEEWEKLEDAKREQWEQENTVPTADDVRFHGLNRVCCHA
jgi:hypothetical protein